MKREYLSLIKNHLKDDKQMVFLGGARQVGKTTISQEILKEYNGLYLNWDYLKHREIILYKLEEEIEKSLYPSLEKQDFIVILDEIHKYKDWKNYLKGLYDLHKDTIKFIVTGSAKLDIYKKSGDSLMGRYFPYTIFPLSVREIINKDFDLERETQNPLEIEKEKFQQLWQFGGFPEVFIKNNKDFYNKWQKTRFQQLFREDIRDSNSIKDIAQLEVLANIIEQKYPGQQLNYSNVAKYIRVSDSTIRRWIDCLESFYYCFRIYPWTKNIPRSLLKEPKIYLYDWSNIEDKGARFENLIAVHLLKYITYLSESGKGNYSLNYIRTKEKKEVDFVVSKDNKIWFLLEVKYSGDKKISPNLKYFHKELQAEHSFQIVYDLPYINKSCFSATDPVIVPAITFLSQLF